MQNQSPQELAAPLIRRLMGHVRYETTLGYDHRGAEDAAEVVKKIAFPYRRRDDS